MKNILFTFALLISFVSYSQIEEDIEVPFAIIEYVPIFPGCDKGNNTERRKCMSQKITKFVQRNFRSDFAGDLGLSGIQRISVIFKIDTNGDVVGVRARASHPKLEKEAVRIISLLPKMKPGIQRGRAVIVPYSLPIIFQVQETEPDIERDAQGNPRLREKDILRPPPPPPPPPPEVIEIVEDEEEVEETVIESTETDQEEEIEIEDLDIEEVEEDIEVSFAVIENVPIFPGCDKGNNAAKKKCMSQEITKFVQRKFNTGLAGDLGLSGRQRISVIFKIDKSGSVVGVRARAPHPRLEKEATRVINLLPDMKPGKQRGKAVIVSYSLPIIFQVQEAEPESREKDIPMI